MQGHGMDMDAMEGRGWPAWAIAGAALLGAACGAVEPEWPSGALAGEWVDESSSFHLHMEEAPSGALTGTVHRIESLQSGLRPDVLDRGTISGRRTRSLVTLRLRYESGSAPEFFEGEMTSARTFRGVVERRMTEESWGGESLAFGAAPPEADSNPVTGSWTGWCCAETPTPGSTWRLNVTQGDAGVVRGTFSAPPTSDSGSPAARSPGGVAEGIRFADRLALFLHHPGGSRDVLLGRFDAGARGMDEFRAMVTGEVLPVVFRRDSGAIRRRQ